MLMPTEAESRSLSRAPPRRGVKLLPAEQFLLAMVKAAPRMAAKATALRFLLDFKTDVEHVRDRLSRAISAYSATLASWPLARLLEVRRTPRAVGVSR